ncbi:hypothetical protein ACHAXR_001786, partial [Thalassiosira sp. AJA248-18]
YSWITSQRRCGCTKDSNHCSGETLTEVYLGGYGVERYGAGGSGGTDGGDDWKAEQWWLDCSRKERDYKASCSNKNGSSGGSHPLKNLDNITHMGDDMNLMKKITNGNNNNKADDDEDTSSRTPSPTSTLSDASSILSSDTQPPQSPHKLSLPPIPHVITEHLDYMSRQPHITIEMRRILMDWLLEVAEEYKLSTEALWLSVALVDRSLACSYAAAAAPGSNDDDDDGTTATNTSDKKKENEKSAAAAEMIVQKDKLQLVGCACTLLASKLIEITPPHVDDMVYISDKTYDRKEILAMEARVCNALKFNLNFRTPYHYVDRFLRASHVSCESFSAGGSSYASFSLSSSANNPQNVLLKKLVFYLLDLAVLEYKLVSKQPSLVTAAAVYLARATLGIREPVPTTSSHHPNCNNARARLFGNTSPPPPSLELCALKGTFWSKTLEYYTGYDIWDVEECVRLLHRLHENAED